MLCGGVSIGSTVCVCVRVCVCAHTHACNMSVCVYVCDECTHFVWVCTFHSPADLSRSL